MKTGSKKHLLIKEGRVERGSNVKRFFTYECQIQTNFHSLENLRAWNVDIRGNCIYWLWKEGRSKRVNRQNYPPSLRWTFCSTSVKQLTQSTRCDFISAVLSNKFLYKVLVTYMFWKNFGLRLDGFTSIFNEEDCKSSWIDWNAQVTVNPLGWPTWRGAPNCETNDWIFAENLLTLPWASKDEGPFFKRRSVVLGSRCFCLWGVATDQIQTLKWHRWGRIDQIWCGNHLPVDWQTFTVSSLW